MPSTIHVQRSVDSTHSSGATCTPARVAVRKFGRPALEDQRVWIKDVALKCVEGGWIFVQKNPLSDRAYVPKVTCADPFCPDFNLPLRPDEHRFSIEPFDNYRIPIVPNHPLADLATVRASPINGEANLRGKGKRGCLWMHVACAESLGIGQLNQVDCVRTEDRPSVHLQFDYRLESPDKYAILKWVAVDKGAIGLLGSDGEIWRKDDGQAVYLSRQAFEYTGQWKGMRVEVRPEDVKNRPLSKVLAYTDILKDRVSKLILNTGIPANLPRAANVLVGRGEGRHAVREGIWESEGEEGAIEDIEEEGIDYDADIDEFGDLIADQGLLKQNSLTKEEKRATRKKAMAWRLNRPSTNLWDEYLTKMRNAALRWTEAKADVTEASTSDGSPMEVTSTQSEGSSSESLRVSTPMVRFLVLDSEDTSSRSPDSPMQEAPLEAANETSSEEGESFESWSDPDRTLATMDRNVGLAMNIF